MPLGRNRRRLYICKDATVKKATSNLDSGSITILVFIVTAAELLGRKVRTLELAHEDEEDEMERPPSPTLTQPNRTYILLP